jgi:diaminopimelate decarboxylase
MDHFQYRDGTLYAEDVPVSQIAEQFGTPTYVYSRATLERHWKAFDTAFAGMPHLVCFAVKANSNLAVLNVLARLGSGFDIVSVGELERVLAAGGDPAKVVFSGVGKQAHEMRRALELGIHCFNVESHAELSRLDQVAGEMGVKAPVSLRVNPDVDAKTHPYISTGLKQNKFGVAIQEAPGFYRKAASLKHIEILGVDCHIGSQLTDLSPFLDALDRVLLLIKQLETDGIKIRHLDIGGGLGVRYRNETPPEPSDYATALREKLSGLPYEVIMEPGRAIAANAGILLTRVDYLKPGQEKNFAIVDAAMNDLIRPSLYQAWQEIIPAVQNASGTAGNYDLVGAICETGDFVGKDRELTLSEGSLLAIRSSGAYGFTMASNYNTRPRTAEIMVDGNQLFEVRRRETIPELFALESLLP